MKYTWKTKTLGKLTSYMSKGIPPKYTDEFSENSVFVLNQKCNRDFKISYEYARFHNTSIKKVPEEKMLKSGDVLINSTGTGTAGRIAQIFNVIKPTTIDGHMILMRPTAEIDALYYGYALKAHQSEIESFAEGSTGQTEINKKRLSDEIFITYPDDISVQKEIASVLFALDNKIELNNQMNKNLEQQISELFKNMFPNVSNNNETDTLEKIISFTNGKKRPTATGNIPVFGGNGILAYTDKSNADNCVIIGRVGAYCGNVSLSLGDCWISDNAISAKSKITKSQLFIFYLLRNCNLPNKHIGTGQPLITQSILNTIPCNIPLIEEIHKFENNSMPLQTLITTNITENQHLSAIRDTLLPKLMSGKILIKEH